jgi:hypothetical protein
MEESVFDPSFGGTMPVYGVGDESVFDPSGGGGGGSTDLLKSIGNILSGKSGSMSQLAGLGGLGALINKFGGSGSSGPTGYQGKIPKYTASRSQLPIPRSTSQSAYPPMRPNMMAGLGRPGMMGTRPAQAMSQYRPLQQSMAAPARRPGSGGVSYFSPMRYVPQGSAPDAGGALPPATATPNPANPNDNLFVDKYAAGGMAQGGLGSLGHYSDGGRLLRGPGDGVSDSIPATIGDNQPARLADGEFVIPARIVSEIGNGSTEAGARKLYAMMDRIQKARKKTLKNVAANTKADKHLPA